MTFSEAMVLMLAGKKVRRKAWSSSYFLGLDNNGKFYGGSDDCLMPVHVTSKNTNYLHGAVDKNDWVEFGITFKDIGVNTRFIYNNITYVKIEPILIESKKYNSFNPDTNRLYWIYDNESVIYEK